MTAKTWARKLFARKAVRPFARPRLLELEDRRVLSAVKFLPPTYAGSPVAGFRVELADFNNDGTLDLVTANGATMVEPMRFAVMRGNGDGTFATTATITLDGLYPTGGTGPVLAVADVNNDGRADIVAANRLDEAFNVYRGNGDGTFQAPSRVVQSPATLPSGMGVGDFNRDGYTDVATIALNSQTLVISYGGPGAFPASHRTLSLPFPGVKITVADYDQDGGEDVGVTGANSYTVVRNLHTPNPSISAYADINPGFGFADSAAGRLRGAGQPLAAVITSVNGFQSRLAVVPDTVGLSPTYNVVPNSYLGGVALADFDRDGFDDAIVGTDQNNGNQVFLGFGRPSGILDFSSFPAMSVFPITYDIATGDLNGDGYLDAMLGGYVLLQAKPSLVVTTAVDENDGHSSPAFGTGTSLREAFEYARSLGGAPTITFAPALGNANAVINLTNGELTLGANSNATVTVRNDTGRITISGNGTRTGFVVQGSSALVLRNLTVRNFAAHLGGVGGAAYVDGGGTLVADGVTFANNAATSYGAAVYAAPGSHTTVRNCTFTGNDGAALALDAAGGSAELDNNTVAGNLRGGVRVLGGTVVLRNNILANNATGGETDLAVAAGSLAGGTNIVRTGPTAGLTGTITADPRLAALANNGGPTFTMALQPGSPAINAGQAVPVIVADQRGIGRPQNGGDDIGAFEARLGPTPTLNPNTLTVNTTSPPVDLAAATHPSIPGGTFSGEGVTNGVFNPAGLTPGQKLITYAGPITAGIDTPGLATLTITVGSFAEALVVTTVMDEDDGTSDPALGTGTSLREALRFAQAGVAVTGFGVNGSGWTLNGPSASVAGSLGTTADVLTITPAQTGQANSIWLNRKVGVANFTARFRYSHDAGSGGADGFTLAFQNAGPNALGGGGGALGYGGIGQSLAFAFNIYAASGPGFAVFTNGAVAGGYTPVGNGVSLTNGQPVDITIAGTASGVTLTMMQGANTFTATFAGLSVAAAVGGPVAYVGFTGSTGGSVALQQVTNFTLAAAAAPATVTFAPALAGQTVVLNTGWDSAGDRSALRVVSDVTLQGPTTGPGVTIGVASGVLKRHLIVDAGGSLTVSHLTFTGGRATDFGGSIRNYGSVTVRDCTFAGNHAGQEGGAIHGLGGPLLRIENSTFAGNSSDGGGAVIGTGAASNVFDHLTIVDNAAPAGGGVLAIYYYTVTMRNSIVARNAGDGTFVLGLGAFAAGSVNNLLGSGSWPGLTDGTNGNRLGVTAAQLDAGTLADNGGPTRTVALMPGSYAVNAGTTLANLPFDQRGDGFARVFGPAADIGAFELQSVPPPAPRVTGVAVNAGQANAEQRSRVTSITVAFDADVTFAGNVADAFAVSRIGGGLVGGFTATAAVVNGVTVVTLTGFTGTETEFGSLADGRFAVLVRANQVSVGGVRLDGDGNGLGGDDYTRDGTVANGLYRLFGDVDGNGTVNAADYGAFRPTFGSSVGQSAYLEWLDLDGDGVINAFDYGRFVQRYGSSVP